MSFNWSDVLVSNNTAINPENKLIGKLLYNMSCIICNMRWFEMYFVRNFT